MKKQKIFSFFLLKHFLCFVQVIRGSLEEREMLGPYHLVRKSGNFGLKLNGKVIFRKFRSEIVEYLQRYSSFSVRNGTADISFHLLNFLVSSLSSAENNYRKSKCKW